MTLILQREVRYNLLVVCATYFFIFVCYQLCPKCKEPIVGIKEQEDLDALNIDIKDLTLLRKPE